MSDQNSMNEPLSSAGQWKMAIRAMSESTALKESTIRSEILQAKNSPEIDQMLRSIYLDENRGESFERFKRSREFQTHREEILRRTDGNLDAKICEIGAGPGFLGVALAQSGFTNVCILEPNGEWITGTGFIEPTAKRLGVKIWNDIDAWYDSSETYDYIISKACVHHFQNISKTAAEISCKLKSGGEWLMFDEFFANTTEDLYAALHEHSHAIKYGQYEWPYSAGLYVDMLELVGYRLIEVLPHRYKSNYLTRNVIEKIRLTRLVTSIAKLLLRLRLSVLAFRLERFLFGSVGLRNRFRIFTRPQLLVFRCQSEKMQAIDKPKVMNLPDIGGPRGQ